MTMVYKSTFSTQPGKDRTSQYHDTLAASRNRDSNRGLDVLVVGAGQAGLITGRLLKRHKYLYFKGIAHFLPASPLFALHKTGKHRRFDVQYTITIDTDILIVGAGPVGLFSPMNVPAGD